MNDNEKLIDAIAEYDATQNVLPDKPQAAYAVVEAARRAMAVFEKAHTPTDNEREALLAALREEGFSGSGEEIGTHETVIFVEHVPDIVLALGFRRSEVLEPSAPWSSAMACFGHCDKEGWYGECVSKKSDAPEPQPEPSDAQVLEALNAYYAPDGYPGRALSHWSEGSVRAMRAALKAAAEGVR